jgi:HK97 family phage major capsid protein
MKTLTQYRADIAALMAKAGDIDAKAVNESRDLNEAEVALKNEILDEVESLHKTVATLERQERLAAKLAAPEPKQTVEKKVEPKIEGGEPQARKDRFNSFGEQLAAVLRAGTDRGIDPRLFNATGLNETTPSDGGFLVQQDFVGDLLQQVWKTSVVAPLCRKVTLSGNANSTVINGVDETSRATGSRAGGIRGYWMGEADEKTASKPKFRRIELSLKKLAGLCYATDEMLADSAQLESVIRSGFASEFGFLLDDSIINGTGNSQPLGVLNAGSLVTQAAVANQGAGTVIAANVISMWSRLFANSRPNAVWLINQEVEPLLINMKIEGANSGVFPVYMPAGGLSGAQYGTLFGRPVIPIEQCQAAGTAGDIILGDFTHGYILAEKGGIQADMSIHVRFIYDESAFRFVMRVDGQPTRASVLTPYKGSATQSHFIVLNSTRT